MDSKQLLKELFLSGLDACSPEQAINNSLRLEGDSLNVQDLDIQFSGLPIFVLAVGKAAVPMMDALEDILGGKISQSLVITPGDERSSTENRREVIYSSHPVPDEHSLRAGKRAVNFIKKIPENALLLTLISGGTSSLLCQPPEGISVSEINELYELLNNSGASIHEINTVRKHCSQVKGGQLLRWLSPNVTLIDLVISDVPHDDLSIIGSGPTTADDSTYQDAYHILLEYELWEKVPQSVRTHIEKGITGEVPETVSPGEDPVNAHHSFIISSARKLGEKIANIAGEKGIESKLAESPFNSNVEKVASEIAKEVRSYGQKVEGGNKSPFLFIYYGESTVKVTGSGKGGRNQELALRGAFKIANHEHITWLSAGTDGIDGPTDAAGAIVDGKTIERAKNEGIDPEKYLEDNDSYHFHKQMGTHLKTGATGNNLMDVVLVFRGDKVAK